MNAPRSATPALETTPLPVAVRAHTVRDKPTSGTRYPRQIGSGAVLVLDTETTVDETHALMFGCWRYYRPTKAGRLLLREEGLFHADDLADTDPAGLAILQGYARTSSSAARSRLRLLSRHEFVSQVFYPAAYDTRATVVGFNLPFDLSRIAIAATEGRGKNIRGFSFTLAAGNTARGYAERRHVPRVNVKHLNSHAAFIHFGRPFQATQRWDGEFVDLRTLTFALTSRGHSLQSACEAFGLAGKADPGEHGRVTSTYIDYCRVDVERTAQLYQSCVGVLKELRLPIEPSQAYSPASLAKATLAAVGVPPHAERANPLPAAMQGRFMSAFYGGRAECRIRLTEVPVTLVDFTSMYPTVFALMRLWDYCVAAEIGTEDATIDVQNFLTTVTLDTMFDPAAWPKLVGIALVEPDGDVLPVRARYDPDKTTFNIGVNHVTSDTPIWYTIADLVASTLLTGRPPTVMRAVRLNHRGELPGLAEWTMPGGQVIDPCVQAPWPAMVEHRQRVREDSTVGKEERDRIALFLKITANSGGYGIYAEYNRQDLAKDKRPEVTVHSYTDEPLTAHLNAPEDPGKYSCPPLAAVITGAARLMLALLERAVTDLGGAWAFADTDSMAIVTADSADPLIPCEGGLERNVAGLDCVRGLAEVEIDDIRARFASLNPYAEDAVPGTDLLKKELTAYCYAIAAKRYALYRYDPDGLPRLVPAAEHQPCSHGLGHLLNPKDPESTDAAWIVQYWEHHLAHTLTKHRPAAPDWFDRPAIGRVAITSPATYRSLARNNKGKNYQGQIRPFGFLLHAPSLEAPDDEDLGRLIAPYENRPSRWLGQNWVDLSRPDHAVRLSVNPDDPDRAIVPTIGSLAATYFTHPEVKSQRDTQTCRRHTRGLLRRRHIQIGQISMIGKEANDLEDRAAGVAPDPGEDPRIHVYDAQYQQQLSDDELAKLQTLDRVRLAMTVSISTRRLRDILKGDSLPRRGTLAALRRALASEDG